MESEMQAEPKVIDLDGNVSDASEHLPMLNNAAANAISDQAAATAARELGLLTEEQIQTYILGK